VCFTNSVYGVDIFPRDSELQTAFIALNPIQKNKTRADKNCSFFRNYLLEIDDLPLNEQTKYIDSFKVPYSTQVYSGNKSFHFIICLEESLALDEYKRYGIWLHKALKKLDHKTKNPSRLTRFPNVIRPDKKRRQDLIYVGERIPLSTFKEWLLSVIPEPKPKKIKPFKPCLDTSIRGFLRKQTTAKIDGEWTHGDRNNELFKASCDFAEQNYPQEECVELLSSNFPFTDNIGEEDQFDEIEFRRTIQSAYEHVRGEIR